MTGNSGQLPFNVKTDKAASESYVGSPIPFGQDPYTGELIPPRNDLPRGVGCGLLCPTCLLYGRPEKEAAIFHMPRGRLKRNGRYGLAYFRHAEKPPEHFPCYRRGYSDEREVLAASGGGGMTAVHYLMCEFLEWYLEHNPEWLSLGQDRRYPEEPGESAALRFDNGFQTPDGPVYFEVQVAALETTVKRRFMNKVQGQIVAVYLRDSEHQEFIKPRLLRWDALTMPKSEGGLDSVEEAEPLAQEIMDYVQNPENSILQNYRTPYVLRKLGELTND